MNKWEMCLARISSTPFLSNFSNVASCTSELLSLYSGLSISELEEMYISIESYLYQAHFSPSVQRMYNHRLSYTYLDFDILRTPLRFDSPSSNPYSVGVLQSTD